MPAPAPWAKSPHTVMSLCGWLGELLEKLAFWM